LAADLGVAPILKAPPPPMFTWSGCQIGGNVGGKWASTSGSMDVARATGPGGPSAVGSFALDRASPDSFIGGGQIGCDYQRGQLVLGFEADYDVQDWSTTRTIGAGAPFPFVAGDSSDISSKWEASFRARVGYAWDRFLLYGTGGVAFSDGQVATNFIASGGFPASFVTDSQTLTGLTLGGGIEYAVWQNVSLGVEGRFSWYGNKTFNGGSLATVGFAPGGPFTFAAASQNIRLETAEVMAKLNYRFWTPAY
jgi:outer membrane immunogenic protein